MRRWKWDNIHKLPLGRVYHIFTR